MAWYPELKLGIVVLTNADQKRSYPVHLCFDVLDAIIGSDIPFYRQQFLNAAHIPPAYPLKIKEDSLSNDALQKLIQNKALPVNAAADSHRSAYAGTYVITAWGFPGETIEIKDSNGELSWTYPGDTIPLGRNSTLTEVQPGLFFSETGNLFDLRGPAPLVDNIPLVKANMQALPFRIALYALCGLIFLVALFFWPVRALIRRIRRKRTPGAETSLQPGDGAWFARAGGIAALASLFSLFCLAMIAIIPNLIHVPWPLSYMDMLWWQFALVSLPFANLLLAAAILSIAVLFTRRQPRTRLVRATILMSGAAVLAFNLVIFL
jgi:hypothetical protein